MQVLTARQKKMAVLTTHRSDLGASQGFCEKLADNSSKCINEKNIISILSVSGTYRRMSNFFPLNLEVPCKVEFARHLTQWKNSYDVCKVGGALICSRMKI
jgi:hypothetical protein